MTDNGSSPGDYTAVNYPWIWYTEIQQNGLIVRTWALISKIMCHNRLVSLVAHLCVPDAGRVACYVSREWYWNSAYGKAKPVPLTEEHRHLEPLPRNNDMYLQKKMKGYWHPTTSFGGTCHLPLGQMIVPPNPRGNDTYIYSVSRDSILTNPMITRFIMRYIISIIPTRGQPCFGYPKVT